MHIYIYKHIPNFYMLKVCMKLEKENIILPPSTGGSVVQNPPANAGDMDSTPESGRFPGERNGNLFQYLCLENLRDRGSLATVHGIAKESDTT